MVRIASGDLLLFLETSEIKFPYNSQQVQLLGSTTFKALVGRELNSEKGGKLNLDAFHSGDTTNHDARARENKTMTPALLLVTFHKGLSIVY